MTHDLVIRSRRIVDGAGNPSYEGDVAVGGDTITALNTVTEKSAREIGAGAVGSIAGSAAKVVF